MAKAKLINERDLRLQYKMDTGNEVETTPNFQLSENNLSYTIWLESQLLEYQNREINKTLNDAKYE